MRDYLYIPLGGNRVKPSRLYVNLWTVFILSGFWHGAAWTFIAWGAYHGLWLVLDRLFLLRLYRRLGAFSIVPTFLLTVVGWVLFRAETLADARAYIGTMVGGTWGPRPYFSLEFWVTLGLAALFSFMAALPRVERWQTTVLAANSWRLPGTLAMSLATALLFVLSASYIIGSNFNPFIYFRF
jgi:alginate O-acetyltransferase complex protein AlgI